MNTQQQNDLVLQQNRERRSKCLVYTRVMGYHRPVESFNIGKKGEHRQRAHFTEENAGRHL
ncbi:anaerobic ribonucleoside-triphosphate reductase [Parapedobacter indicus]|uniref:Anaerobic ribonucleoside-triphosphate reductase n=1 Tax=Parapedobacter indicus TaxID=1477437 RepID=A0A1I3N4K3_9SPHI|nr:anaerobic ribonucleoside-triphosphate reductase [Parapedobacter indicus]PPL00871.1 anaerobic ribonucleoside-triphosphate reductase-like protein [Parapedobacter indicus]SFJ03950.1 Anaerobic ribonucleoside-triphosphate reductase [Parapedobacter indicus]